MSSKVLNFFGVGSSTEIAFATSESDPFNPELFPDEIQQLILNYLPVKDLLESSLVSKLWNSAIGSSDAFRKRTTVNLHFWDEEFPNAIVNSNRNYETLTLCNSKSSAKVLSKIPTFGNKNWRNVTISIGKISSQKGFIKFLEVFESVRYLKVLSTNIRELNTSKKMVFSELEHLILSDVSLDLFDILIAQQPSLKSLSLRFISCDICSPRRVGEAILEFFSINRILKDLEINYLVTNDLFLADVAAKVQLKLKSLTLGLDETTPPVCRNVEAFLRSQGQSLEHLKFVRHQKIARKGPNEWGYWDRNNFGHGSDERSPNDIAIIFNSWNSLSSLKSISIRSLNNSTDFEFDPELMRNLKRNTNITLLNVQFINFNFQHTITIELMKLCPNLNSIYVTKLSPTIVRHAAINLKALKQLKCYEFEGDCLQEYNDLKMTRNDINKLILISNQCALG